MSLYEFINTLAKDGGSWILLLFLITSLIEITPIKINPISELFKWIGGKINSEMNERITSIETKLDKHIEESNEEHKKQEEERILVRREKFITFASRLAHGYMPTEEECAEFIKYCDEYEIYCHKNNYPNGVAFSSAKLIREKYYELLKSDGFAKNEEDR